MNLNWLKNLKINQKMLVLNGICVGFILIVGFTGYFFTSNVQQAISTLYNDRALPLKWLGENNTILKDNEAQLLILLTGQSGNKEENLNKLKQMLKLSTITSNFMKKPNWTRLKWIIWQN